MTARQITLLAVILPLVAIGGFLFHELGHWGVGELLGYDMLMSLNGAAPIGRHLDVTPIDAIAIKAAGPAVTLLLATLSLLLVRASAVLGFALAFFSLHMRIAAYAISILVNPNDEASIGLQLGIGPHIVHLAVIAILWVLALMVGRKAGAGWLAWLVAFIESSASIALVVIILDSLLGRIL